MEKAVESIICARNRASASFSSAAGVFRRPSQRDRISKAAGSEVYATEDHVQVTWDEIPSSSNDRPWVLVLNKRGKQGTFIPCAKLFSLKLGELDSLLAPRYLLFVVNVHS